MSAAGVPCGRDLVAKVESGNRQLTAAELITLVQVFGVDLGEILAGSFVERFVAMFGVPPVPHATTCDDG
jgi:hypothetical protein